MRITAVRAIPLTALFSDMFGGEEKVPAHLFRPASHFQRIRRVGQHSTIVTIDTDDGITGVGEAFGLPSPLIAAEAVAGVLAPGLIGLDPLACAGVLTDFKRYFEALGHSKGPLMEALSAVDIAIWDIKAQAAGKSLAQLLGGEPARLGVYASPIPFYENPEDSRETAASLVKKGYKAVKLKVGRGLTTDLAHIEAVRDGVGRGVKLMLDVNCAYDPRTAIALAQACRNYDVAWLEEPVPGDDVLGLVEVRRASPVPIACGENEFTLRAFEALVRAGAADIVQPNVTRAGGVTECLRIAELCSERGVSFSPHGIGGAVGVAAMLHVCSVTPAFYLYEANQLPNPLRDDLLVEKIRFENGALVTPGSAGHGAKIDWETARRYVDPGYRRPVDLR